MDLDGPALEAAQQLLSRHGERAIDFRFRKIVGPPVSDEAGHTYAQDHIEVSTKRRGVRVAHYLHGGGHDWLAEFETDIAKRRFRAEGD